MMIRTSIAAVVVTLAAIAPSFAGGYGDGYGGYGGYGYDGRTPYAAPAYEDTTNRLVVDPYSGRVTFEQPVTDHCGPRRHGAWTYYGRRVGPDYGY